MRPMAGRIEGGLTGLLGRDGAESGLVGEVFLRNFGTGNEPEFGDIAHLIDIDPKVGTSADEAVGVLGRESICLHQPLDQLDRGALDSKFQRTGNVDRNDALGFDDAR